MKKLNKNFLMVLLSLVSIFAMCFALSACETAHTHTADDTWHTDATYHWHECTADDGEILDKAEHTFEIKYDENGHWQECSECGYITTSTEHTLVDKYDETGHWQECSECGYTTASTTHTLEDKYNENGHWQECECGYATEVTAHTLETKYDENGHWYECTECDYVSASEAHDLECVSDGENGQHYECDCGYATATGAHTLVTKYDENGHWQECSECGYATASTAHTLVDKYDETGHWQECECGYTTEVTAHTLETKYDENGHWQECENCSYATTSEAHDLECVYDSESGHHHECDCGYETATEAHEANSSGYIVTSTTHYYLCKECGEKYGEAEHSYTILVSDGANGHHYECVCGAKQSETSTAHTLTYVSDGESGHHQECSDGCGYKTETTSHESSLVSDGADGHHYKCSSCDYATSTTSHNMSSDYTCTADGHYHVCSDGCGYTSTVESHNFSDGTGICSVCGYSVYTVENGVITAYSGTIAELTIPSTINGETITEIGSSAFADNTSLAKLVISEGITTINNYAFQGCSNLTSVTFPESLTVIKVNAFSGTTSLTAMYITDLAKWCSVSISGNGHPFTSAYTSGGGKIYLNNTEIVSLEIPESVTSINAFTFYGCSSITSVTIHSKVTSIGDYAFGYSGLTSVTIPDSVTKLDDLVFYRCSSLKSVTLGSGISSIGQYLFEYSAIEEITIPSTVSSIGIYAFANCTSLKTIVFMYAGNITIADYNFDTTTSLMSVYFNMSAESLSSMLNDTTYYSATHNKSIESLMLISYCYYESNPYENSTDLSSVKGAWYLNEGTITLWEKSSSCSHVDEADSDGYCDGVCDLCGENLSWTLNSENVIIGYSGEATKVIIPSSVKVDGVDVSITQIGAGSRTDVVSTVLTNIKVSSGISTIGGYAFYQNTSLVSVYIPESVITIGTYAFRECTSLSDVKIDGKGLLSIGSYAFASCAISELTIPESVTTIDAGAFSATSLTSMIIPDSVISFGTAVFNNCVNLKYVELGEGVTTIGLNTFYCAATKGTSSLETVVFKGKITSINYQAFRLCSSLTAVYWNMSAEDLYTFLNDTDAYGVKNNYNPSATDMMAMSYCYYSTDPSETTYSGDTMVSDSDNYKSCKGGWYYDINNEIKLW